MRNFKKNGVYNNGEVGKRTSSIQRDFKKSGSTTMVLRKCLLSTEGMRNSKMIGLWRYREWKTVKYDYHPFALRVHKNLHHHAEGAVSTLDDRCLEQMSRWTGWWDCVGKR